MIRQISRPSHSADEQFGSTRHFQRCRILLPSAKLRRRRSQNREGNPMPTRAHPQVEALEPRQFLSAGDLDRSFGSGGVLLRDDLNSAYSVAVQADGKILLFA